jgi:dihydroorotate dehydrogenase (NAD+) catalytic subunit
MLSIKIKDITFNSPIIAASGTFGYGYEVKDMVDLNKIGCVITKSITFESREGNPQPRLHMSSSGMLNAIGLANVGVNKFCRDKLPKLDNLGTNVIISIAGSCIEEYINILKIIESSNGKHIGYEINISCPNVKKGGMEFGINSEITNKLTKALRLLTDRLLIVKLSPNVTSIEDIALAAESGGADMISAVNTFLGTAIDYKTGKFSLSSKFGGLSGPAIKPIALAKVNKIYKKVNIPIIGMGGVSSFQDVIEFIRLGSTLVQMGTLNYRDPSMICNFYDEIKLFIEESEFSSINELVGKFDE